jgi:hypothetical protein
MTTHDPLTIAHFWTKVDAPSDFQCWTWKGSANEKGYGRFENAPAHRWSFEFFNGPIPAGKMLLHSCDNPACVNPKHLRADTHWANERDAVARNRYCNAKLTEDQVRYIRRNPDNLLLKDLAARLGLARSTVSYVRSGITWKHVA